MNTSHVIRTGLSDTLESWLKKYNYFYRKRDEKHSPEADLISFDIYDCVPDLKTTLLINCHSDNQGNMLYFESIIIGNLPLKKVDRINETLMRLSYIHNVEFSLRDDSSVVVETKIHIPEDCDDPDYVFKYTISKYLYAVGIAIPEICYEAWNM